MTTTPDERAALRTRAEWIRDHSPAHVEPRVVLAADVLLALLDDLDRKEPK